MQTLVALAAQAMKRHKTLCHKVASDPVCHCELAFSNKKINKNKYNILQCLHLTQDVLKIVISFVKVIDGKLNCSLK